MNKTDRYQLVIDALQKVMVKNPGLAKKANQIIRSCEGKLKEHARYILKFGKDMPEHENWK